MPVLAAMGPAEKRRLDEAVAQWVAGGPLRFQTSSAFALNLGLGFAALVLPGVFLWLRARSYAAVLDDRGALTRAGHRHRWEDLERVSTREFRRHYRGWYIGQRLVETCSLPTSLWSRQDPNRWRSRSRRRRPWMLETISGVRAQVNR